MVRLSLLALCLVHSLQAQSGTPVIRVNTRLVQVNVIVSDKHGPAQELTKDDFVLLDRGKERAISFFAIERAGAVTVSDPLPPNVFANRQEQNRAIPANVTVVLIDGLNTRIEDQAYAREQLRKFMRQVTPQDHIAIYALGTNLRVLQEFTSDARQIDRVLAKDRGSHGAELAASEPDIANTGNDHLDQFLDEANSLLADYAKIRRARITLSALESIAEHVAFIPGRKNLVWLTGSFPFSTNTGVTGLSSPSSNPHSFAEESRRATEALNNANIALYAVDARGLIGLPASLNATSKGPFRANQPPPRISMTPTGLDTMEELATATGGRAFYNTNDLAGAVRKAVEDAAFTYTLGFYPDQDSLDGKFHELKVRVRQKGLNVRHRKGYLALRDQPLSDQERESAIETALWSPLDAGHISLVAKVDRVDNPESKTYRVVVALNPRQLHLEEKNDRMVGKIEVLFTLQDAASKVLDSARDVVGLNLTQANYALYQRQGMTIVRSIPASAELATIRLVLADTASGAVGSLIIPISKVQ